jgi:hypothetical protein
MSTIGVPFSHQDGDFFFFLIGKQRGRCPEVFRDTGVGDLEGLGTKAGLAGYCACKTGYRITF